MIARIFCIILGHKWHNRFASECGLRTCSRCALHDFKEKEPMPDNLLQFEVEALKRELDICLRDLSVICHHQVYFTRKGILVYVIDDQRVGTDDLVVMAGATLRMRRKDEPIK